MKYTDDFWRFWGGQTISNLGTSLTLFALPLLVFTLTHSALTLGISAAINFLPYLLFGLIIGAWVDRFNRKHLMILADLMRALLITSIPVLYITGHLPVWWIYIIGFATTTLSIVFDTSEFASIPDLVKEQDIVTANGRIQASYSTATVIGPFLGGLLIAFIPIPFLMFFDAASFLISVCSLLLIKTNFNATPKKQQERSSLRTDIVEGLHFVLKHPILRNIACMMAIINFLTAPIDALLVLFASVHFHASLSEIALFYSAGGLGVVVLTLSAGWLRKRLSFGPITLSALFLKGLLIVGFALIPWYGVALVLWAGMSGLGNLFNINTNSFRQTIVPKHMLGRVRSISIVLAWSVIPIGSLAGSAVLERLNNISSIFCAIGVTLLLTAFVFSFTEIRRAERYLPAKIQVAMPEVVVQKKEADLVE